MSYSVVDYLGTKRWYNSKGEYHREDAPAIEFYHGLKYWYINGELHREDGPAIENDHGYKQWYFKGERIMCKSNEEFLRIIKLKVFW